MHSVATGTLTLVLIGCNLTSLNWVAHLNINDAWHKTKCLKNTWYTFFFLGKLDQMTNGANIQWKYAKNTNIAFHLTATEQ